MTDLEYYRRRAQEEHERANTATDEMVGAIHLALAQSYDALIEEYALGPGSRERTSIPAATDVR